MTPSQLDHLRLLKAHLETLLESAKSRTPGEWLIDSANGVMTDYIGSAYICYPDTKEDATFIASCAGNAEAGWQSTLAAIDWVLKCEQFRESVRDTSWPELEITTNILAAWPIENLR